MNFYQEVKELFGLSSTTDDALALLCLLSFVIIILLVFISALIIIIAMPDDRQIEEHRKTRIEFQRISDKSDAILKDINKNLEEIKEISKSSKKKR